MNPTRVLIVGMGAQAKYCIDTFSLRDDIDVIGLVRTTLRTERSVETLLGVDVLGGLDDLGDIVQDEVDAAIACSPSPREKLDLVDKLRSLGIPLTNAIHPGATISAFATIGEGVIVNAGGVIQPLAQVGSGVMVHANVVIEHDNKIGDFVNLGPGATLAGWVRVGAASTIYTNATVIPKITIGAQAVVGAGAVVIRDVPNGAVVVGNPARVISSGKGN